MSFLTLILPSQDPYFSPRYISGAGGLPSTSWPNFVEEISSLVWVSCLQLKSESSNAFRRSLPVCLISLAT